MCKFQHTRCIFPFLISFFFLFLEVPMFASITKHWKSIKEAIQNLITIEEGRKIPRQWIFTEYTENGFCVAFYLFHKIFFFFISFIVIGFFLKNRLWISFAWNIMFVSTRSRIHIQRNKNREKKKKRRKE